MKHSQLQDSEQVKEARVRFAQLYKEVTKMEGPASGRTWKSGTVWHGEEKCCKFMQHIANCKTAVSAGLCRV